MGTIFFIYALQMRNRPLAFVFPLLLTKIAKQSKATNLEEEEKLQE